MPYLVRFLLRHALIGVVLAVAFVGVLLALDIAGLGTLMWQSPSGPVAAFALTVALSVTFGSAQMGFAVMLLPEDDAPRPRDGGHRSGQLLPARLRVRSRRV
jgi:hypothetical protein